MENDRITKLRLQGEKAISICMGGQLGNIDVPHVVLAHGADNNFSHPLIKTVHDKIIEANMASLRFNFPYAETGNKKRDSDNVLEMAYRGVINFLKNEFKVDLPFIGGKSLGARIASQIVSQGIQVMGLIFLGYPLHAPGRPERAKWNHLLNISIPMLFFQGKRDPFAICTAVDNLLKNLSAPYKLYEIPDGNHSLIPAGCTPEDEKRIYEEIGEKTVIWIKNIHKDYCHGKL